MQNQSSYNQLGNTLHEDLVLLWEADLVHLQGTIVVAVGLTTLVTRICSRCEPGFDIL
jgi:hypothetical protein